METLFGMVLIVTGIGGGVIILLGLLVAVMTVPDLFRVASVLRTGLVAAPSVGDGRVAVQGLVSCESPLLALTDASPLVWRRLKVYEQVGKHTLERATSVSAVPFDLDDGQGVVRVDPHQATVLSPGMLGGPMTDAVASWVGPVFAWPKTPKHYFEETLAPGDFVTVVGDALDGELMGSLWIVRGEPKLRATEEFRTFVWGLLAVPGGALVSWVSWVLLEWAL